MHSFDPEDMLHSMGPGGASKAIADAIQFCWISIPKERRTVPELKRVVQQLVDRAFRDLDEDQALFGSSQ